MRYFLYVVASLVFILTCFGLGKELIHMAQLEGYKPSQYGRWLKKNLYSVFLEKGLILLTAVGAIIFFIAYFINYNELLGIFFVLAWAAINIYVIYKNRKTKKEAKKPLVFTHRAIRLFVFYLLLSVLWLSLSLSTLYQNNIAYYILCISIISFLLPVNMYIAIAVMYPVEMMVHYRYFRSAQNKIYDMKELKVIGITGSYGKTSTKYFVKTILSEKYNTLMTPESYNTPMGISKVIREELKDEHEVFVCEMGARNVGDIKQLTKLVNPSIGILTSIGSQHLETFKSIENVAKTKYELIEALPYDGTAIFNGDNSYCLELAKKTGIETLIYGIENNDDSLFIKATDIETSIEGLKFRVKGGENIDFQCETSLLGKHNVSNMLAAISVALKLGLTTDEIKRGISKIKPVPHRLEIVKSSNGVMVIDDAFNSNPAGSLEALETIKTLPGGNKIVITPGMVELGAIEYDENKKFGVNIAKTCDAAILIGIKRSKPIVEGLRQEKFPEESIHVVSSLEEATQRLGTIVKAGDIVLFENDLPDNYDE